MFKTQLHNKFLLSSSGAELRPFEVAEQGAMVVRPSPGDKPGCKFLDRFQLADMSGVVGIPE